MHAQRAKLPMLEPVGFAGVQGLHASTAYQISEQFDAPVLLRTYDPRRALQEPGGLRQRARSTDAQALCSAIRARCHDAAPAIRDHESPASWKRRMQGSGRLWRTLLLSTGWRCTAARSASITASIAYQYAKGGSSRRTRSFLKLGLTNPLPIELIRRLCRARSRSSMSSKSSTASWRPRSKPLASPCEGKELTGTLDELSTRSCLRERIFGKEAPITLDVGVTAVSRPPALCPGCPHRGVSSIRWQSTRTIVVTRRYRLLYSRRAAPLERGRQLSSAWAAASASAWACLRPLTMHRPDTSKSLRRHGRLHLLPQRHDRRGGDHLQQGQHHPRRAWITPSPA